MVTFNYRGRYAGGQRVSGEMRAKTAEALRIRLLEQDIILESYEETLSRLDRWRLRAIGSGEITQATRQMATLLEAGLTVSEVVQSLAEEETLQRLTIVYRSIIARLEAGERLSATLEAHPELFDRTFVALVEAGESSGELPAIMTRLAEHRERMEDLRRKFYTAMVYPALVVIVSALVLAAVFKYVIPVFSEMYASFGAQMPPLTQNVVDAGKLIGEWFWALLGGLLALSLLSGALYQIRSVKVFFHRLALLTPLLGRTWRKISLARFARTLGTLQSGGAELLSATAISSRALGNAYLEDRLSCVIDRLASGVNLRDALAETGVFPSAMLRMVASGEKTGRLGEMLSNGAKYFEKELESHLTALTSVIEPLIILLLGLIVGFIVVVMYLPLFDLINEIGP